MIAPTRLDVMRKAELCREHPTDEDSYKAFIRSLAWRIAHDVIARPGCLHLWYANTANNLKNEDINMLSLAYGIPLETIGRWEATARNIFVDVYRKELLTAYESSKGQK